MKLKKRKKYSILKAVQTTFSSDVINDQAQGDFNAAELIQIYRNHYILSLIDALKPSYSCILRLVGEDFFKLWAKNYISVYPHLVLVICKIMASFLLNF